MAEHLGVVISGSIADGIDVKLDSAASVEDMAVGRYVTIDGKKRRFFGMITDIRLNVTDPDLAIDPPDSKDPFLAEVLSGTSTYGTLHVIPMLTIGRRREYYLRAATRKDHSDPFLQCKPRL